ncbi:MULTISPECIES: endo alpha-1,4 polygalactosaminidase [Marinomonas]|uniref:Endo alpha-1,4 polygalactosaminidase n=1 Tax=Marinomonas arctica TaxID=383750 RepID=A0A7H1J5C0_9GAMM|nr:MULTISPECIES: endo alpha-1,4 polygalactosaminidase [Marinomonas]MCS7486389.1 endo alpha-1,4 polygalactosaminidase [Marinomonas sp. BSi20414]QNT05686.1 endo alpha-1,4 polygalactosaminidase [Marinomonas arctica]GGN29470.1 endo alpha-1,4 polygalactosaminidase [Marinomonas arctica]
MRTVFFPFIAFCLLLSLFFAPLYAANDWYRPPVGATWHWQLDGEVNESYDVAIYDIDLFDSSVELIQRLQASGKKVICYFSAGSYEDWRPDATDFSEQDLGKTLKGWDDERWLDIRSSQVRDVMVRRLNLAAEKGCDGVEPDNVDSYRTNTGFSFRANDQLDYNRFLATQAHQLGLGIGLKNNPDQARLLSSDFDFAVTEQCFEYSECRSYSGLIQAGKPVLNAEYRRIYVDDESERNSMCKQSQRLAFSTLVLPKTLDDQFRLSCEP